MRFYIKVNKKRIKMEGYPLIFYSKFTFYKIFVLSVFYSFSKKLITLQLNQKHSIKYKHWSYKMIQTPATVLDDRMVRFKTYLERTKMVHNQTNTTVFVGYLIMKSETSLHTIFAEGLSPTKWGSVRL